ncbi:hypothetical protein D9981_16260 [Pseudoalteromonas phenolica O-BC30]|nr:hypothetical protein D9981_16260 [Pseudoalteromonas phenolica O-BC30]
MRLYHWLSSFFCASNCDRQSVWGASCSVIRWAQPLINKKKHEQNQMNLFQMLFLPFHICRMFDKILGFLAGLEQFIGSYDHYRTWY